MKTNVGRTDRNVRLVLGALLAIVGVLGYAGFVSVTFLGIGQALGSVLLALVGLVLLATGVARVCLVYRLVGIDTPGAESDPEVEATAEKPA